MKLDSKLMVECKTPTPGKSSTRIAQWKYDAVRKAILEILRERQEGVEFRLLPDLVRQELTDDICRQLGSMSWYTVTVKLHMETIGEIERVRINNRQVLMLTQ